MKRRTLFLMIAASIAYLCIPIFSSPDFNTGRSYFLKEGFLRTFFRQNLLLLFFFINFVVLLPKLYFAKKYLAYFGIVTICFALVEWLPGILIPNVNMPPMGPPPGPPFGNGPRLPFFQFLDGGVFQFLLIFIVSFLFKMNTHLEKIAAEKQAAEIANLKAKINPHFLFNSLNSIYALTLAKSDGASVAVLKLSRIMRYVVTEIDRDRVPVENEMAYIKDYIDLQKLRSDKNADIQFTIEGDSAGKYIAPLLLIHFIENAFKYGINPEKKSTVHIFIQITINTLIMNVENSIVNTALSEMEKTDTGIDNTVKRLNYIYPKRHQLNVTQQNDCFKVNLLILL